MLTAFDSVRRTSCPCGHVSRCVQYMDIVRNNSLMMSYVFFVPCFYGCVSPEYLAAHTSASTRKRFGMGPLDFFLAADCQEERRGAASGSLAEHRNSYSKKTRTATYKCAGACTDDLLCVWMPRLVGGRAPEVVALEEFFELIRDALTLTHLYFAVDRGYRDLKNVVALLEHVCVLMPSHLHGRQQFDDVEAAINTAISQSRVIIECFWGQLKSESRVRARRAACSRSR